MVVKLLKLRLEYSDSITLEELKEVTKTVYPPSEKDLASYVDRNPEPAYEQIVRNVVSHKAYNDFATYTNEVFKKKISKK